MTIFILLFFSFLLPAVTTAANQGFIQSVECTTTKLKPNSCLYFVLRNDLAHKPAAEYCYTAFNGALAYMNYSESEIMDFSKRYFWWAKSNKNVDRLHTAMAISPSMHNFEERGVDPVMTPSNINPKEALNLIVDDSIWYRSFNPEYNSLHHTLHRSLRDKNYPARDEDGKTTGRDIYVNINPKTSQWSGTLSGRTLPFICEVPRFPKIYCQKGWMLNLKSRSCLKLYKKELNYAEAISRCQSKNANLAAIESSEELNMILRPFYYTVNAPIIWTATRLDTKKYNDNLTRYLSYTNDEDSKRESVQLFLDEVAFNIDSSQPTPFFRYNTMMDQNPRLNDISTNLADRCFILEKGSIFKNCDCNTVKARPLCRKMASTQRIK